MRALYFFLNKLLKPEEEIDNKSDNRSHPVLLASYTLTQSSSNWKYQEEILPKSYFVEVPHVIQLFSWDCGLACVLMVLRTIGINGCNMQMLGEFCCTTSVWTVDLAYLLKKFSVRFSYFTVTLGANPKFSAESFYQDQLSNDITRVDRLFQRAVEAGINIQCRSISREEISFFILSGKYIAIALVDQLKLRQPWIEDICGGNSSYTGHYVIICGYDSTTDEFEIRDPASSRKSVCVSSKSLEEARKSFGTDEDLLLPILAPTG